MRVLVLGNCQGKGGGPTHFRLLIDFLLAEQHQVFGIGIGDKDIDLPARTGLFELVRLEQTTTNSLSKLLKTLKLVGLLSKINQFKPELFVGIGYGYSYSFLASRLDDSTFTFYQELICDPPEGDPLRTQLVAAFDGIAVQSPGMRPAFLRSIPTTKPVISLPCFSFRPEEGFSASLPGPEERLRLAYFGRLAANKGLPNFLEAFVAVAERLDATLDIHGDGEERLLIAERVRSLKLDRVRLLGAYPGGKDYARLLSSYHALVLPSIATEGLPLVLLEAMSYGLPYLSTKIGAILDSAIDNPDVLIVEPTVESLAAGLIELTGRLRAGKIDPQRLKAYYDRHFSYDVMAQTWQKMLQSPRQYFAEQHQLAKTVRL